MRHAVTWAVLVVVTAAAGCRPTHDAEQSVELARSPGEWMVRTELMFGMNKPDGGQVSEAEWRAFVEREVTPRFPAGLTVLDGWGQWREEDGSITREPARLLILLHDGGDASGQIERIRERYKAAFQQDAVLRADSRERVAF